jgi:hypothetical protein
LRVLEKTAVAELNKFVENSYWVDFWWDNKEEGDRMAHMNVRHIRGELEAVKRAIILQCR